MVMVLGEYVTVTEASHRLGVSAQGVRLMVAKGQLQAVRDPRSHRWILAASLDRLIAERAARGKAKVRP